MTVHWATEDLPATAWDPEPDDGQDDDGPWCCQPTRDCEPDGLDDWLDLLAPRNYDLQGQGVPRWQLQGITDIHLTGTYL